MFESIVKDFKDSSFRVFLCLCNINNPSIVLKCSYGAVKSNPSCQQKSDHCYYTQGLKVNVSSENLIKYLLEFYDSFTLTT